MKMTKPNPFSVIPTTAGRKTSNNSSDDEVEESSLPSSAALARAHRRSRLIATGRMSSEGVSFEKAESNVVSKNVETNEEDEDLSIATLTQSNRGTTNVGSNRPSSTAGGNAATISVPDGSDIAGNSGRTKVGRFLPISIFRRATSDLEEPSTKDDYNVEEGSAEESSAASATNELNTTANTIETNEDDVIETKAPSSKVVEEKKDKVGSKKKRDGSWCALLLIFGIAALVIGLGVGISKTSASSSSSLKSPTASSQNDAVASTVVESDGGGSGGSAISSTDISATQEVVPVDECPCFSEESLWLYANNETDFDCGTPNSQPEFMVEFRKYAVCSGIDCGTPTRACMALSSTDGWATSEEVANIEISEAQDYQCRLNILAVCPVWSTTTDDQGETIQDDTNVLVPTVEPTKVPSAGTTIGPTKEPTTTPPSASQTGSPTGIPTAYPTGAPTGGPTRAPTGGPTGSPTGSPTGGPTGSTTGAPTGLPSPSPTKLPTPAPISTPTEPTAFICPCYDKEEIDELIEKHGDVQYCGDEITSGVAAIMEFTSKSFCTGFCALDGKDGRMCGSIRSRNGKEDIQSITEGEDLACREIMRETTESANISSCKWMA